MKRNGFFVQFCIIAWILLCVTGCATISTEERTKNEIQAIREGRFFQQSFSYVDPALPIEQHSAIYIAKEFGFTPVNRIDGKKPNQDISGPGGKGTQPGRVIFLPPGTHSFKVQWTGHGDSNYVFDLGNDFIPGHSYAMITDWEKYRYESERNLIFKITTRIIDLGDTELEAIPTNDVSVFYPVADILEGIGVLREKYKNK